MQKQDEKEVPQIDRENWKAQDLVQESSGEDSDETVRKVLRGNENQGDADERDIAGAAGSDRTPQGSEENKHQIEVEKNG